MAYARRVARPKKRGVAILLAIFFMILLDLIAITLIGMVPVELRTATRTQLDMQAHYAATAGVRNAKAFISAVLTPTTTNTSTDFVGDDSTTVDNSHTTGAVGINDEVMSVKSSAAGVDYFVTPLSGLFGSGYIPTNNTNWSTTGGVWKMLNIPSTGSFSVDASTLVAVKKVPLVMGDWSVYTVIIPDYTTPGGKGTLDSSGKITGTFGGTHCFQVIALAFYQGFPVSRAKTTLVEQSFGRYSLFVDSDPTSSWFLQAIAGQQTTSGPVHTNGLFRFAMDPSLWTDTSGVVPFNGLMTFSQYGGVAQGITGVNGDGNEYFQGNDAAGTGTGYRPFDDTGNDPGGRYNKMVGGRSNLQQTQTVALPPDSTKIATQAYGQGYDTSMYSNAAVSVALWGQSTDSTAAHYHPYQPNGLFVFPDSTGGAGGGTVVKGDTKNMFLEVVDGQGHPIGTPADPSMSSKLSSMQNSSLASNMVANANPGMHIQEQSGAVSTQPSTSTSYGSTVFTSSSSTGMKYKTTVITPSSSFSTGQTTTPGGTTIQYSTSTSIQTFSPQTTTLFGTSTTYTPSTSFQYFPLSSQSFWVQGNAGGTPMSSWVTYSTSTSTIVNPSGSVHVSSSSTGQNVNTPPDKTHLIPISTGQTVGTGGIKTLYSTSFGTPITNTLSSTTQYSTSYSTSSSSSLIPTSTTVSSWNPIDQLVEVKNTPVTLGTAMWGSNSSLYNLPAAAIGTSNSMDVGTMNLSKILVMTPTGISTTLTGGNTTAIPTGSIVVMKQSRDDPTVAVAFVIPSKTATDPITGNPSLSYLNGVVLSEGNIGGPNSGGVAGVNYGAKTIGGQIPPASGGTLDPANPLNVQSGTAATSIGISNQLWQLGTSLVETNPLSLAANNGLGIVAQMVQINAAANQFTNTFGSGGTNGWAAKNILNIHAIILAGSSTAATGATNGLTVQNYSSASSLTPGNMGTGSGYTPLVRFVGGLITHNYYERLGANAGWNSLNYYNQNLANKPPPAFPTNGVMQPVSYVEERIWSDHR